MTQDESHQQLPPLPPHSEGSHESRVLPPQSVGHEVEDSVPLQIPSPQYSPVEHTPHPPLSTSPTQMESHDDRQQYESMAQTQDSTVETVHPSPPWASQQFPIPPKQSAGQPVEVSEPLQHPSPQKVPQSSQQAQVSSPPAATQYPSPQVVPQSS